LLALCLTAVLHVAALIVMAATEADRVASVAFLLSWALLNFFWLALVRRPVVAALLSLELIVALILLSRFKFDKLWMTVDFVDVMIIDRDTSAFLLTIVPSLLGWLALAAALTATLLIVTWRLDPRRVGVRTSLIGGALSMTALVGLSLTFPTGLQEDFISQNYVSKFARSGVEAVHELATHGFLESDARVAGSLAPRTVCQPARKLPHIILLHDESSFDITVALDIRVPSGYQHHFQSLDGKARKLVVEGVGGPSWFTEYNVLTGLSVRSYGRFATSVTRIAAGHLHRSLPLSLSHCGYKTFSLYPFHGAFLGSRAFQTSVGIANYLDMVDLGTSDFEADGFYFDQAIRLIERERGNGPLIVVDVMVPEEALVCS